MNIRKLYFGFLSPLLLAASLAATAAPVTFTCSTTVGSAGCTAAIPDAVGATPGQIISTIPVTACGVGGIPTVTASVNISHPWVGDLQLSLANPSATIVPLLTNLADAANTPGGCQSDDVNATFADAGVTATCGFAIPAVGGTVKPVTPMAPFAAQSVGGTWTLTVKDTQNGNNGLLNDWAVIVDCASPTLTVVKTVANITHPGGPNNAGDVLAYTVTVTNTGTLPTAGATMTDAIPAGTTLVAGSTQVNGVASATPVPGPLPIQSTGAGAGQINVGAANAAVITFRVTAATVLAANPTTVTNTASATFTGGGVATSLPATINLVDIPPVATGAAVGGIVPSSSTNLAALSATDADGTVASFTLTSLPPAAQGTLFVNNVAAVLNQVITPVQAGQLKFTAAATFSGTSFNFTATDNFNVASNTATITLSLSPPPVANPLTVPAIVVGNASPTCFTLTGTPAAGTIASFTILTLPTIGSLVLNNVPVVANQVIPAAQISNLCFAAGGGSVGSTSFTFLVTDSLGAVSTPATVSASFVAAATGPAALIPTLSNIMLLMLSILLGFAAVLTRFRRQ